MRSNVGQKRQAIHANSASGPTMLIAPARGPGEGTGSAT
jgi:hypothetical protein